MKLRWKPPDARREPVNIHPDAKLALFQLLFWDYRFHGVGYSEFIMAAVQFAKQHGMFDDPEIIRTFREYQERYTS